MPKKRRLRKRKLLPKIFLLLLVVFAGVFMFADVGGDILLGIADRNLNYTYRASLTAKKITGNPIKGYVFHGVDIIDDEGREILTAEDVSGNLDLTALLSGKLSLAKLFVSGFMANLDILRKSEREAIEIRKYLHNLSAKNFPFDKVRLKNGRISSYKAIMDVKDITADFRKHDIDIDTDINGIALTGKIDFEENASINNSSLAFGSAHITATGGLEGGMLDLHAVIDGADLKDFAALFQEEFSTEEYSGTASMNMDISGKLDSPRISGTIDSKSLMIAGYQAERFSANFSYENYHVNANNIQASIFGVPIHGEISAQRKPGEKLSVILRLDGNAVNIEDILGIKGLTGKIETFSANIYGYIDSLRGRGKLSARRIIYDRRITADDVNISANLLNGAISSRWTAKLFGGNISTDIIYSTDNKIFTGKVNASGVNMKQAKHVLPEEFDGNVTNIKFAGIMDFSGNNAAIRFTSVSAETTKIN